MGLLDDLGKKIGETVKVVGDKSEELVETSKANIQIGKEEGAIKKLYSQIGQRVYKAYLEGVSDSDEVDNLCRQVDKHRARIEELKKRLENE